MSNAPESNCRPASAALLPRCSKKMKNLIKNYWTVRKMTCNLRTLHALSVVILWVGSTAYVFAQENGKTKIQASVVVKESRILEQLSEVERELETLRREKSALEERASRLERETSRLRQELIDNMQRYQTQNDRCGRLQLNIAAALANSGQAQPGNREGELYDALQQLCAKNNHLAIAISDFCDYMDTVLSRTNMDAVQKAEITVRLDAIRSRSAKLGTAAELAVHNQTPGETKILEVNEKLRMVILAAGSVNGVKNGLNWFTGKNKDCRLQVIAVRPFIAAAVVVEGNIRELAPGISAYTRSEKNQN